MTAGQRVPFCHQSTLHQELATSVSNECPLRFILKQTPYTILPLLFPENEREVTPKPRHPFSDLHYLDGPVNRILASCKFCRSH